MAQLFELSNWITTENHNNENCPLFKKCWTMNGYAVKTAKLFITALGVYDLKVNGSKVSDYVLAPGWTDYEKRLQYQEYDIKNLLNLKELNEISITLGKGWFKSPMPGWLDTVEKKYRSERIDGILALIEITFEDGSIQSITTDKSWKCYESNIVSSDIYDGEYVDATFEKKSIALQTMDLPKDNLIPQEGNNIKEREFIFPKAMFKTPKGETIVDFGQEITGYVQLNVNAAYGDKIHFIHGEVLDANGNFYNDNYRTAKTSVTYICKDGIQSWHPTLTFFGFRYIKLIEFPGTPSIKNFVGISVYSDIQQTGNITTSSGLLNQLISNIFWGQKDNFLDIPTDCPQRDERLGWTGDAAAFIKAASYNFDVRKFFKKWLGDVRAGQNEDGSVSDVIPDYLNDNHVSAAWGDVITIVPWQLYVTYGDISFLQDNYDAMKRWVDYITKNTNDQYLWTGGDHFGDWLGLDAQDGSYKGSSRDDLIASAYYANSTKILIDAGKIIGRNVQRYEILYKRIVQQFRQQYPIYHTQSECAVALQYELAEDKKQVANQLNDFIKQNNGNMATGFVGTPKILHALSKNGYMNTAYDLLTKRTYPSWLYAVDKGATTIWEHWDSLKTDGSFWSADMNSFNHYAYGSVIDWMYEEMLGIQVLEAGFKSIKYFPKVDPRLKWVKGSMNTVNGKITAGWTVVGNKIRYELETPIDAKIMINDSAKFVKPGKYTFWGNI